MRRVCMGGTFDILHIGHEALLTQASNIGDKILVGLTTNERAKKGRNADFLNSYEIRKRNLETLLESLGFLNKFEIVDKDIDETIDLVTSQRKRKMWVNTNLEILKKKFPHKIMARKLQRAIIRRRINY